MRPWLRPVLRRLAAAGAIALLAWGPARAQNQVFSQPIAGLGAAERQAFAQGRALFHEGAARRNPTSLGPHFSATACAGCHVRDGRGSVLAPGRLASVGDGTRFVNAEPALLARLAGMGAESAARYGMQLTGRAVTGLAPRGRLQVAYRAVPGRFADGTRYVLREPIYRVAGLGYGPLPPATVLSPRLAPQLVGMGLLDAVPEEDILREAERQARDGATPGRAAQVWDPIEEKPALGRFGWKAGTASLHHQTGLALEQDMGITTTRFSGRACAAAMACRTDSPELGEATFLRLLDYQFGLAVPRPSVQAPAMRARAAQGGALFVQAGCAACHKPSWTTGKGWFPGMSRRAIEPYTDLLLHDMGDALGDRRLDGALPTAEADGLEAAATARRWRTPPLWRLGLLRQVNGHQQLLHDGRADGVLEAILWHGGEAESARQQVLAMPRAQRDALVAFVNSL